MAPFRPSPAFPRKKFAALLAVTVALLAASLMERPAAARWSDYYEYTDRITANYYDNVRPAAVIDPLTGVTHMTYTSIATGGVSSDIYYKNSTGKDGLLGSEEVLLSTTSKDNDYSDVALDSAGNVHVVFAGVPGWASYGRRQIFYTNNTGGAFSSPVALTWSLNHKANPKLVVDDSGNVHVFYQQLDDGVDDKWHLAYVNITGGVTPSKPIGFTYTSDQLNAQGSFLMNDTINYWDAYPGTVHSQLVPFYELPGFDVSGGRLEVENVTATTEYRTISDVDSLADYQEVRNQTGNYEWVAAAFTLTENATVPFISCAVEFNNTAGNLQFLLTDSLSDDFTTGRIIANHSVNPVSTNGTWRIFQWVPSQSWENNLAPGTYYVVFRAARAIEPFTYLRWGRAAAAGKQYYRKPLSGNWETVAGQELSLRIQVNPQQTDGSPVLITPTTAGIKVNVTNAPPSPLISDYYQVLPGSFYPGPAYYNFTSSRSIMAYVNFTFDYQYRGGYSVVYNDAPHAFTDDCTDPSVALSKQGGVTTLHLTFTYGGKVVYFEANQTTGFGVWRGRDIDAGGTNAEPDLVVHEDRVYVAYQKAGTPAEVYVANSTDGGTTFSSPWRVSRGVLDGMDSRDPTVAVANNGSVELAYVHETDGGGENTAEILIASSFESYFGGTHDRVCNNESAVGRKMRYYDPVLAAHNGSVSLFYVSKEKYFNTWQPYQVCVFSYAFIYKDSDGDSQLVEVTDDPQGSYLFESLRISYGALSADLPIRVEIEDVFSGQKWSNTTVLPASPDGSAGAEPTNQYYHEVVFWNEDEYFISNGTYRLTLSNASNAETFLRVLVDGTELYTGTESVTYLVDDEGNHVVLNSSINLGTGANMVCLEWYWAGSRVSFDEATDNPLKARSGTFNTQNNVDWYELTLKQGLYYNFSFTETTDYDYLTFALFNESARTTNLSNAIFWGTTAATNKSHYLYKSEETKRYFLMVRKNVFRGNMSYIINFDRIPRMAVLNDPLDGKVFKSFTELDYSVEDETPATAFLLGPSGSGVLRSTFNVSKPNVWRVEVYTELGDPNAAPSLKAYLRDRYGTLLGSATVPNSSIVDGGWTGIEFGVEWVPVNSRRDVELELRLGTEFGSNPTKMPVYKNAQGKLLLRSYGTLHLQYDVALDDALVTADYLDHYEVQLSAYASFQEAQVYYQDYDSERAGLLPLGETGVSEVQEGINFPGGYMYYWRVRVVDVRGNNGNWTASRRFIIDNVAPNAPVVEELEQFTTSESVRLTWTANASDQFGISSYSVYVSTTPGFTPSSETLVASGITSTTYSVGGLVTDEYYFKVTAVDFAGWVSDPSNEVSTIVVVAGGEVDVDVVRHQTFQVQVGDHLEFEVTNVLSETVDASNIPYIYEPTLLERTTVNGISTKTPIMYQPGARLHFWIKYINKEWIIPVWAQLYFKGPKETVYRNLDNEDLFPSIIYVINQNETYQFAVLKSWLRNRLPSASVLYALNYTSTTIIGSQLVEATCYTFWEVTEVTGADVERTTATFVYDKLSGALLEMFIYDRNAKEGYSLKLVDTSLDLAEKPTWIPPTYLALGLILLGVATAALVKKMEG
ncbi:MAG: hypothetical protein Kow0069_26470 [Promethearchaeota archaeon]